MVVLGQILRLRVESPVEVPVDKEPLTKSRIAVRRYPIESRKEVEKGRWLSVGEGDKLEHARGRAVMTAARTGDEDRGGSRSTVSTRWLRRRKDGAGQCSAEKLWQSAAKVRRLLGVSSPRG